ncbi:MAG TPA: SRPBCC domain-containing protein [Pirellulaceae bacterium]|nr:SRPBCC domain-containing protein [Pirellulaceae bacterium]
MTETSSNLTQPDQPMVVITRLFNAPRELVFQAWTDPEQLLRWYAPPGCTIRFRTLDVRPGGAYHSCIQTPDGHHCWCSGSYREIVAPERIVYSMAISDEHGHLLTATEAGMDPAWPRETMVTVTFADRGGRTELTLRQTVLESLAKRTGAHPSWLLMLDRLEEQLGTK